MKWWVWLLLPFAVVSFFYLHDLVSGVYPPYSSPRPHPRYPELGTPWPMHPVDNPGDWLPNGLDVADVNADGFPDFLVNYEWTGRIRVVFHPGRALSPRSFGLRWMSVTSPTRKTRPLGTSTWTGLWTSWWFRAWSTGKNPQGCASSLGKPRRILPASQRVFAGETMGFFPKALGLGIIFT